MVTGKHAFWSEPTGLALRLYQRFFKQILEFHSGKYFGSFGKLKFQAKSLSHTARLKPCTLRSPFRMDSYRKQLQTRLCGNSESIFAKDWTDPDLVGA